MIKKAIIAAVALAAMPATAAEDWWYAESDRFRVYSAGGEEKARDMAIKLERLDDAMRLFTGVSPETGPVPEVSKPTIFQFGETDDIGKLAGQRGVAGFFIPRAGDSVAFVPLEQGRPQRFNSSLGTRSNLEFYDYDIDPEVVLFHEYAHYFMFQHAPSTYPSWYIEGLAELFGMLRIEGNGFALGDPPPHREGEMVAVKVDTDKMFQANSSYYGSYPLYGHGWLVTSYLSFAPGREGQLAQYLKLLNQGTQAPEAAKQAFGDMRKLEKELNDYRKERARGISAQFPELATPAVEVRKLTADQAARMPIYIESSAGVTKAEAGKLASDAAELMKRYPDSVPVMRTALEAEFDDGDLDSAKAIAERMLETDAAVDANLYLAKIALEYAKTDKKWLTTAREHYAAANRLNPDEPNALKGYYLTYRFAGETPPEPALIAIEQAYKLAPFDESIRMALAHLFLLEQRDAFAMSLLSPVIYQPHAGKSGKELRDLVEKFNKGDRQPLIDKLEPKLDDKDS